MLKKVVVVDATIQCSHGGKAQLPKGDNRLQISNKSVVTAGQEKGISFATTQTPCPFKVGNKPSPCTATMAATAGIATLLMVGGGGGLLEKATGQATNDNDSSAAWEGVDPGQTPLRVDH